MRYRVFHNFTRHPVQSPYSCVDSGRYYIAHRHASTAFPGKPYYVTSPIFYVNATPHIGHLHTLVLTDILKRWQILQGRRAILCTGTDEHGLKVIQADYYTLHTADSMGSIQIQQAAAKAGQDVRTFCDHIYKSFNILAKRARVDFDHFIRTSEPDHRFAVQHFWVMLKERGHIYSSKHEGWYSISDETFYPASAVHIILDPSTGRKFMASIETGKEVEWTSETNYHFRLSAFRKRLLDFYDENPDFVIPSTRMENVRQHVVDGLEDLSVSRPADRLSWGIPVPDDNSQTIYVWLDALINYLTKANYPFQIPGEEHAAGWPADVQVIGKDIVRFHCVYWPAFLMALDLPLPRQILTHAFWTLGKAKMAKSTGNVVNPFFALDRFGVDTMRYYLAHDGGIRDDANYENSYIIEKYKKGLQGGLGNLVSRVMRGKGWDVRRAVKSAASGAEPISDEQAQRHRECLIALPGVVESLMKRLDSGAALREIMNTIHKTNGFMQHMSPWDMAAKKQDYTRLDSLIFLLAESIRICAILLQPFMPDKMANLLNMLGVSPEARLFENAYVGVDSDYGTPSIPMGRGHHGVLFPPLRSDN